MNDRKLSMLIGGDDFIRLAESDVFVDKSLFIKEILTSDEVATLITAPRRWGKSINMDMLYRFLSIAVDKYGTKCPNNPFKAYFEGGELRSEFNETKTLKPLKISTVNSGLYMKYQGEFPVIYVSFKDINGKDEEEIYSNLGYTISNLYAGHSYLYEWLKNSKDIADQSIMENFSRILFQNATIVEINNSLLTLAKLMNRFYKKKVYVLVDEYDKPLSRIIDKYAEKGLSDDLIRDSIKSIAGSITSMLATVGKGNSAIVEKIILTGVLDTLKKEGNSGFNNVIIRSALKDTKFSGSFGFVRDEIHTLVYTLTPTSSCIKNNSQIITDTIKEWYDGYTIHLPDKKTLDVYTPWSVMRYLKDAYDHCHLQGNPFWADSGRSTILDTFIRKTIDKQSSKILAEKFSGLTKDIPQIFDLGSSTYLFDNLGSSVGTERVFSHLLFHSGYITYSSTDPHKFVIPNNEIRLDFSRLIIERLTESKESPNNEINTLLEESRYALFAPEFQTMSLKILNSTPMDHSGILLYGKGLCINSCANFDLLQLSIISGNFEIYQKLSEFCQDIAPSQRNDLINYIDLTKSSEIKNEFYNDSFTPTAIQYDNYYKAKCGFIYLTSPIVSVAFAGIGVALSMIIPGASSMIRLATGITSIVTGITIYLKSWTDSLTELFKDTCHYYNIKIYPPNEMETFEQFSKYIKENEDSGYAVVNQNCMENDRLIVNRTFSILKHDCWPNSDTFYVSLCGHNIKESENEL